MVKIGDTYIDSHSENKYEIVDITEELIVLRAVDINLRREVNEAMLESNFKEI